MIFLPRNTKADVLAGDRPPPGLLIVEQPEMADLLRIVERTADASANSGAMV